MIRVSDLNRYVYCPRSIYLSNVLKVRVPESPEQGRGVVGHAVRRELSMRQARLLNKMKSVEDVDSMMKTELDAVLQDLPYIFAERWSESYGEFISSVRGEMMRELDCLRMELDAMVSDMGFEKALEYVTPWRTEYSVKSEELGLKGRVDKIMRRDSLEPVEIKTGVPHDFGWDGDRVQLCGYGMLLEERFGERIPHGFIEYTRAAERKPVLFTEKLRRQVIYARDSVKEILDGVVPDVCPHGIPQKCGGCVLKEECYRT